MNITATDLIAFMALVFSAIALAVTLVSERRRLREELIFNQLQLQSDRNIATEAKLADWPDALRFYGIDVAQASAEGLSTNQIVYLVLSIDALTVECTIRQVSVSEYLRTSDYRQLMFAQEETRRAWKYARRCISEKWRKHIDQFLFERYGEQYDALIEKTS